MDVSPSSSALRTNPAGDLGVLVFGSAPITERYPDGSPVLPIPAGATPDDLVHAQADGWNLLGIVSAGSPAGLVDMYVLSR
ncbi:hypothetical protein [Cellulosimicrobium funkei]|uniref:hypothetical protein n=1 Tax=Cellulosimicrobium funkei TaxID=264251 RepID=UPI0030F96868